MIWRREKEGEGRYTLEHIWETYSPIRRNTRKQGNTSTFDRKLSSSGASRQITITKEEGSKEEDRQEGADVKKKRKKKKKKREDKLGQKKTFWQWAGLVLLYVHRNRRLIRDGSPGRPPRLSYSSGALKMWQ